MRSADKIFGGNGFRQPDFGEGGPALCRGGDPRGLKKQPGAATHSLCPPSLPPTPPSLLDCNSGTSPQRRRDRCRGTAPCAPFCTIPAASAQTTHPVPGGFLRGCQFYLVLGVFLKVFVKRCRRFFFSLVTRGWIAPLPRRRGRVIPPLQGIPPCPLEAGGGCVLFFLHIRQKVPKNFGTPKLTLKSGSP